MIGSIVSHYKILEKLDEGGMGMVYKAEDTRLKRTVALKFLAPELTSDRGAKDRFINEAQAASALEHNNICNIHEIGETEEGHLFIAMACYEGESLKSRIAKGPLQIKVATDIALQIAQGLQKAHEKEIIHRDIKPGNIFITTDGTVKILDFGLAKLAGHAKLTKTGSTVGTAAYMSPEQARGQEIDRRTDIWSLGVVMYEMLTGRLPFAGDYEQAIVYNVLNQEPEPLAAAYVKVPVWLQQMVEKAMAKNADKRYQRADEIAAELQAMREEMKAGVAEQRPIRLRIPLKKRSYLYGGIALLLAAIVAVKLFLYTGTSMKVNSIAVLPLTNLSGDPGQEYFADGMTDELITDLAKVKALKVISRTSIMQYKGTKKPLPQIARELNVDAVIEGSVLREGGQVRISAQLIQAATDQHLWAESYQRDLRGVLTLQGEIAGAIVERVRAALTAGERARLARARPVDPEAHDAYLKGMQCSYRLTPQDLGTALEYLEVALKKDPSYAAAYAGVAFVWLFRQQFGYTAPREAGPRARAAALKAIELDSTLGEGHSALAAVEFLYGWDWAGAEVEFTRAIELNPNFPDARSIYSTYLMAMKRPGEAMAQIRRALELDPLNALIQLHYGSLLLFSGRYDEAIVQYSKLLRTSPENPGAHAGLAAIFFLRSRYRESLAETKASYAVDHEMQETLTQGYAQSGYRGAMKCAADMMAARARKTYVGPVEVATLYNEAGEKDRALEWLEKGLEVRDPVMAYLDLWPDLEPLRSDPRFQNLLRRMNLPE